MKKILIPTDFSESAQKALDFALNFNAVIKAKIYLVNSYLIPHAGATMMVSVDDLLKSDSLKNLAIAEAKIKEKHPNIDLSTHSMAGDINNVILDFCKDYKIDYIVMGTTGASGWQGKLFGSNTANLIGAVTCPIFAIPFTSKVNTPCNIAISTDLVTPNSDNVYAPVKELATVLGSSVRFVNITTKSSIKELDDSERSFGNEVDFVFENSIGTGLSDYLELNKVDLLVVIAKKHSFFERLFKASVSKQLAKETYRAYVVFARQIKRFKSTNLILIP